MSGFLKPNIERRGRILRGVTAVLLLIAGIIAVTQIVWLGLILLGSGIFVAYEALRGWCIMRACGIKTRL